MIEHIYDADGDLIATIDHPDPEPQPAEPVEALTATLVSKGTLTVDEAHDILGHDSPVEPGPAPQPTKKEEDTP